MWSYASYSPRADFRESEVPVADRGDVVAVLAQIGPAHVSRSCVSSFAFQVAFRSAGDESEFIAYIMDVRGIENEFIIIKLMNECSMVLDPRRRLLLVLRFGKRSI